jgi:hypothetical protein
MVGEPHRCRPPPVGAGAVVDGSEPREGECGRCGANVDCGPKVEGGWVTGGGTRGWERAEMVDAGGVGRRRRGSGCGRMAASTTGDGGLAVEGRRSPRGEAALGPEGSDPTRVRRQRQLVAISWASGSRLEPPKFSDRRGGSRLGVEARCLCSGRRVPIDFLGRRRASTATVYKAPRHSEWDVGGYPQSAPPQRDRHRVDVRGRLPPDEPGAGSHNRPDSAL